MKDMKRARLARVSHVPCTADVQLQATINEHVIARMLQGDTTDQNDEVDVIVGQHGVEVKTLARGQRDKITVHPSSRRRKESWARKHKAMLHTVAVDDRGDKRTLYYRSGVGAYRLHTMTVVRSASHLRQLVNA